jgi:hypothetical protein
MRKYVLVALVPFLATAAYSADFSCGNVVCLIAAINTANSNGQDNSIFLDEGVYTLTTVDNMTDGPNGLPSITGSMTIRGPENIGSTIERDPNVPSLRIFQIASNGKLRLEWLGIRQGSLSDIVQAGQPPVGGGAILNRGSLTITNAAVYNNQVLVTNGGGAIYNFGTLAISKSDLRDNTAEDSAGGAISSFGSLFIEDSNIFHNDADVGSALVVEGSGVLIRTSVYNNFSSFDTIRSEFSTLDIEDSDVHDNHPILGPSIGNFSGVLNIVSSTIARNDAGIFNSGELLLRNVTVAANTSTVLSLRAGISNTGTVRLQNTIVALNTFRGTTSMASDCDVVTSLGNNVIGDLTGCQVVLRTTDHVGNPGLDSFTLNPSIPGSGNFPLLRSSPAVNAGSNGGCTPRDQLGERRRGVCDIGAVEFQVIERTARVSGPKITGTLGNNGWYRSSVTANWIVSDPESGIISTP